QRRPESVDAVKREFLARHQDYVTRQRLSEIRNAVIQVGEEDDLLAFDPPKVTGIDWKNGELTLFFDRRVNGGWEQALRRIATREWIGRVTPQTIHLVGDRAVVQAQEHEVQTAVNYIKNWLPRATEVYRRDRDQARRKAAEDERKKLDVERDELE